jgi:hypothetical protein
VAEVLAEGSAADSVAALAVGLAVEAAVLAAAEHRAAGSYECREFL